MSSRTFPKLWGSGRVVGSVCINEACDCLTLTEYSQVEKHDLSCAISLTQAREFRYRRFVFSQFRCDEHIIRSKLPAPGFRFVEIKGYRLERHSFKVLHGARSPQPRERDCPKASPQRRYKFIQIGQNSK